MKKKYFLIIYLLLQSIVSVSQVSSYTFSQTNTTYSSITGGTLLGSAANDEQYFIDPANLAGGNLTNGGPGFPIGFNFTYNGNTFDRFGVNANGWMSLGQSILSTPVYMGPTGGFAYSPLSEGTSISPSQLRSRISGLGTDLQGQTGSSLRFQTIGAFPNRTLVVQWTGYKRWGTNGNGDNFAFQIRLSESTNQVSIVYDQIVFTSAIQTQCQVGLGGDTNADFNNRATVPINGNWNASFAGVASTNGCFINTGATTPVSGLSFNWQKTFPCTSSNPTTQASALNINIPFTTATVTWTNGNGARRVVLLSKTPIVAPINNTGPVMVANTFYSGSGQQVIFDGSTGSSVNVTGLALSELYYVAVFEYNYCPNGAQLDYYYNSATSAASSKTFATQVQNDFCFGPTVLTPSGSFATGAIVGTMLNANTTTGSPVPNFPSCQTFAVSDVWYSVVVPASGRLTIETQVNSVDSITDSVIGVYSGADCFGLTQIACDDDSGPAGSNDLMAVTTVTGRTPGETLFIGVWNYNITPTISNRFFRIAAYDVSLGTEDFDEASFSAYPNPVKDILHLTYKNQIDEIIVFNMLGQEVAAKQIKNNEANIDMSSLLKGNYFVKVISEQQSKIVKIVKSE